MALDKARLEFVLGNVSALPEQSKANLRNDFVLRYLLSSTTIESKVSLTLDEIKAFFHDEEFECSALSKNIKNRLLCQKRAYDFMMNCVENDTFFNEELIKKFHEIIMENEFGAGTYRTVNISVNGSLYVPPRYEKIDARMQRMFDEMKNYENPLELAAFVHASLDKIHPFLDGNGRCARLVINYFLIKNKLLPITFDNEIKEKYFKALEDFKTFKDLRPLIELISELENQELMNYEKEIKKYI